jgi:hypothetical protein
VEIAVTVAVGYPRVHWRLAGSLPDGEVRVRFRMTVPPADVVAEESEREDCASVTLHVIANKAVTRTGRATSADLNIRLCTPCDMSLAVLELTFNVVDG